VTSGSFLGLLGLPVDFSYPAFAVLLLLSGIGQGMFSAPNTSAIMSSVPSGQRGVASGIRATFQNSGNALSIGVFFSLMIAGPFHHGLVLVFTAAATMAAIAPLGSALRGTRYVHTEERA
jgi:sugar phosphate permease